MNKKIIPMGLDDIPEQFRKYSECDAAHNEVRKTGDMLFMLMAMLILFDL